MRGGNENKWRGSNKTEELELAKKLKKWKLAIKFKKVRSDKDIRKS